MNFAAIVAKPLKLSLSQKAVCLIAIPFIVQIVLLSQYETLVQRVERLASHQYYSKAILNHGNWITMLLSVACNSLMAYSATRDQEYLTIYRACLQSLPSSFNETKQLIDKQSPQFQSVVLFQKAGEEIQHKLEVGRELAASGDSNKLLQDLSNPNAKLLWHKMFTARHDLLAYDRLALVNDPDALPAARQSQKTILATLFAVDFFSAFFIIYAFNAQIGRKLIFLGRNAKFMGSRQPLQKMLQGNDEIAILDQALHKASNDLLQAQQKLEESEKRLSLVIKHLPVGLLGLDANGLVQTANDESQRLVSLNENDLVGHSVTQFLPGVDLKQLLSMGSLETKEVEIPGDDDRPLILELSSRNYSTANVELSLLAMHDITARRELERMRQDFLNMVSHDLRGPLTSIRLFLNLLNRNIYGEITEGGRDNVARAERNVDRLLNMINDLLDFEKMQAGLIELDIEVLSVKELAAAASDLMQGVAQKYNVKIEIGETDSFLAGDRERLVQVMANLLSNAMKFSKPGSSVIVQSEENENWTEVKIIDSGRGIPAEKIDSIFDKFKQVEALDAKAKKGIGLGLPICKWIIEQHSGEIGVFSEPGVGSTFWFRLKRPSTSLEL